MCTWFFLYIIIIILTAYRVSQTSMILSPILAFFGFVALCKAYMELSKGNNGNKHKVELIIATYLYVLAGLFF